MEYQGTILDYVRHAKFRKTNNDVHTVKTLHMPENQSYTFYAASDGLATVKSGYLDWTLTAPEAMFLFREFTTVGDFLDALTEYLPDNPVFTWEELATELAQNSALTAINTALGSGSVTLHGNSNTYTGTNAALASPGSFADVAEWLAGVCAAASGSIRDAPISEITQSGSGRAYKFTITGAATITITFCLPAYEEPIYGDGDTIHVYDEDFEETNAPAVVYHEDLDEYFDSLAAAVANSETGETLYLIRDETLTGNVTIPSGVTLVIPSSTSLNDTINGNNIYGRLHGGAAYCTLTLNANLAISGTLIVGGNQQSWYTDIACRTGNYGAIKISAGCYLASTQTGKIYARGLVHGDGTLVTSGKLYTPMQVHDWRGGTASQSAYQTHSVWPFNLYEFGCIRCDMQIAKAATMYGVVFAYSSAYGGSKQDVEIIGSGGIFVIDSGRIDISRSGNVSVWTVTGESHVMYADMSVTVLMSRYTISGEFIPFPLWRMRLVVDTGATLHIDNGAALRFLPGAGMTVKGTLDVAKLGELYFYRAQEYRTLYIRPMDGFGWFDGTDAALMLDGGTIVMDAAASGTADTTMTQTSSSGSLNYYSWTISANQAKVTGNRTNSAKVGYSQTLTITATDDGVLSFDYTYPSYITLTIDGKTKTSAGTFTKKMLTGDSITVRVTFSKDSGSSRTVMLSNIVQDLAGEATIASSDANLSNLPAALTATWETVTITEYMQSISSPYNVTMYPGSNNA